jgi:hypothetical protein
MLSIDAPLEIDGRAVKKKVADWTARIKKLHLQLDDWVQGYPNALATRGEMKQVVEPLMKRFHVAAQSIPTYTVFVDKKWRIAFVPSAIWILGANGRIDITTNVRQHILVDLGGRDGAPSDWQLVVADASKLLIPFDKVAFRNLLGERR